MVTKDALTDYGRKRKRKKFTMRHLTVGASEIGQCARKIFYMKDRSDTDFDFTESWGAAKRGVIFENKFFVPAMRAKYGKNLLYAGTEQITLKTEFLSATPDGLLINQSYAALKELFVNNIGPSGEIVVDCKTIDPRIKLSEPKPEHIYQAQVQLGMFRLQTKHKPDYAVLSYTNASFFDDTVEFAIRYNQKIFEAALARAEMIKSAVRAEELKPEGWIAGGKECEYCPWYRACARLRNAVPEKNVSTVDPQTLVEFWDLAIEERKAAATKDSAVTAHRDVQEKIKERMREKDLRSIKDGGNLSIVWSPVKGRPSFDMVKLKAAAQAVGLDVQQFETVGDPSDRLQIQVLKKDRLVTFSEQIGKSNEQSGNRNTRRA